MALPGFILRRHSLAKGRELLERKLQEGSLLFLDMFKKQASFVHVISETGGGGRIFAQDDNIFVHEHAIDVTGLPIKGEVFLSCWQMNESGCRENVVDVAPELAASGSLAPLRGG